MFQGGGKDSKDTKGLRDGKMRVFAVPGVLLFLLLCPPWVTWSASGAQKETTDIMDQEQEGVGLNMFLRILKEAVGQILHLQHGDAFLSWMRVEAPRRFPEVFTGLPERVRRALATELGRQIWNVTPIPRRDFRPMPLPRPKASDPCPCRSGRAYERCCANAPAMPGLTPELMWALVAGFVCAIDDGAYNPCKSGVTFSDLDPGPQKFAVRARRGGRTSEPAVWKWTVVPGGGGEDPGPANS